ncbi:hypothetical protein HKBW3S06_00731 [Candidatus Hakubella thermalkaliphila]|uniref:HicB-like antitoxin of toxin-antitoxin system domain-containing protein n=1 Tax=Candidatus Hakubella thermalkaliphila TaxID=2754717 RepID=A0A6V8NQ42_9ACTN|nr:hypothetical protein HKBW3S06_00731 [Candidatus Hakubella thermalkaliphila]
MFKYEVIIYWSEEDGLFIAEVPELPGGGTYLIQAVEINQVARQALLYRQKSRFWK